MKAKSWKNLPRLTDAEIGQRGFGEPRAQRAYEPIEEEEAEEELQSREGISGGQPKPLDKIFRS